MEDTFRMEDTFYILAADSTADNVTRVLKEGESFAVFDRYGDIQSVGLGEEGVYHTGTRFISRLVFTLGNHRPFLLNSTIKEDNLLLVVNLTNPDIYHLGRIVLPRGTLYITRSKLLRQGVCYESFRITNYALSPVDLSFSVEYGADFTDIFEVRGVKRQRRGRYLKERVEADRVCLAYEGLDAVLRRTQIEFAPEPKTATSRKATFNVYLNRKEQKEFLFTYRFDVNGSKPAGRVHYYRQARKEAEFALTQAQAEGCQIWSSNEKFNEWVNRSISDLHMMMTETEHGLYPYAGVPWFSTVFGRDGIITALEFLWINPHLTKGVLSYLASTQAREKDIERDAEPGKILHETRTGEMAAVGEIPVDRYYGTVDATPLFVMLAGAYFDHTYDLEFIEKIWPSIDLALRWMDDYGDQDGDRFVEYARQSSRGLLHQGWKDSWDSVFHADGSLVQGSVALCEVQGYAYAARLSAAKLAAALGENARAAILLKQAEDLRTHFEEAFWLEELSTYALALDGEKNPCRVKASNAGHCLLSGITSPPHARSVAEALMAESCFSGWGVRTLATSEARYNPMSYHNGSIWPHDNALVAAGLSRYGFREEVKRIFQALFDACLSFELRRLPELYCGFPRKKGEGPIPYPVACSPQSWAAGSVFLLLQACLGMTFEIPQSRITFKNPVLPDFLDEVRLKNVRVGEGAVDLNIRRYLQTTVIAVERHKGSVAVIVEK
ncbi:MAG: amylo-alpha-1,6-glucosidase [Deltaproteobacteria bacterium]|nr:amylo-alpha-1,6-glucosidase [Deltaproteobacteria bacterium]